ALSAQRVGAPTVGALLADDPPGLLGRRDSLRSPRLDSILTFLRHPQLANLPRPSGASKRGPASSVATTRRRASFSATKNSSGGSRCRVNHRHRAPACS